MSFSEKKDAVLSELDAAMAKVDDSAVERLLSEILAANQVFFVGVGRVMLVSLCIVKRLAHLGISAHYVGEITEPAIGPGDLLIVCSGSGTTVFPLAIAEKAKNFGAKVVHIGSSANSAMAKYADFMVRIPVRTKQYSDDEIDSAQPMTSLFEQSLLLLGDILAGMIIENKSLDLKDLWKHHANLE